ncbi:hypothetical protein LTR27_007474 [Elasticomyces elasticus]|nr:hypothetical protein LTR27_007474 [Elasticomyces elasticus]
MSSNRFTGANVGGIQGGRLHVGGNINVYPQASSSDGSNVAITHTCLQSLYFGGMYTSMDTMELERAPGTGDWIFAHPQYRSWRSGGGILTITGRPGCGKSMLMHHTSTQESASYDVSRPKGNIVLSFALHEGDNKLLHSELGLYRALLHQMLCNDEDLLSDFVLDSQFTERFRTRVLVADKFEWSVTMLRDQLFGLARKVFRQGRKVRIFLDGLDAMDQEAACRVIGVFKSWSADAQSDISVCLSSRALPCLETEGAGLIELEKENQEDVVAYLNARLTLEGTRLSAAELDKIREYLYNRTAHVFRWLSWICPQVRMLAESGENFKAILDHITGFPKDLKDVYIQQLARIPQADVEKALRIFQWITLPKEPLAVEDLRIAVCLEDGVQYYSVDDLTESKHWCDSETFYRRVMRFSGKMVRQVIMPIQFTRGASMWYEGRNVYQYDHSSVREFMADHGLQLLQDRLARPAQSTASMHMSLAGRCLAYLMCEEIIDFQAIQNSSDVLEILPGVFRSVREEAREDLARRLASNAAMGQPTLVKSGEFQENQPRLAFYAAKEWASHVKMAECESVESSEIKNVICTFGATEWTHIVNMNVLANNGRGASTPLHLMAEHGLDRTLSVIFDATLESSAKASSSHDKLCSMRSYCVQQLDDVDPIGWTPLCLAAACGWSQTVKFLLGYGAGTNRVDADRRSALHWAVIHRHEDVIRALLASEHIDVDARDKYNATPLLVAVVVGHIESVRLLRPVSKLGVHCANVSATGLEVRKGLNTPLMYASIMGSIAILKELLRCDKIDSRL